jgi:hyaluronan synthase
MDTRKSYWIFGVALVALVTGLIDYRWRQLHLPIGWREAVNIFSFLWILSTVAISHANPEWKAKKSQTKHFNVGVVVPAYNEDPITFRAMLDSFDAQTRIPQSIYVIDDGSLTNEIELVFKEWRKQSKIKGYFTKQANAGKREAQAKAFRNSPDVDIYITVDSDTVLDSKAIENGLKPFVNPKIMSVAGLLVGLNYKSNLLTRLVDLTFVSSFLNGRSAWSKVHSLAVNCGGLAFYRGTVVRKHLDEYVSQTVFGVKTTCGDDRIMTNFALLEGWTVFQENSVGYTLLPANIKHLTKQRIRWWRSFFWGSEWLIRRFPMTRLVWWLVAYQLISFALYTIIVPLVLIVSPLAHHTFPAIFFLYIFALSYMRNMRYLSLKRPDQSYAQQVFTYLLSPLGTILYMFLGGVLQYIGLFTMKDMSWNTRAKVEVVTDKKTISDLS